MSEFKINLQKLNEILNEKEQWLSLLQQSSEQINDIKLDLSMKIQQKERIRNRIAITVRETENHQTALAHMINTGRQAAREYQDSERKLLNIDIPDSVTGDTGASKKYYREKHPSWIESFVYWIMENIFGYEPIEDDYEIDSVVFDEEGQYGGDQGAPKSEWGADSDKKELYDIVRKYYPDYSDQEINQYLKKLNNEGCGYVAVINTIFAAYEGRESEFEKTFGFPMYNDDGDLNYNRLLVDYYSATDNHNKGASGDRIDNMEDYSVSEDGNENYDFRMDATGRGSSQYDRDYRTHLYLDEKGVPVNIKTDYQMTPGDFPEVSEEGYVIIAYRYGNLQHEDGSVAQYINGGHAMVITGVTADGRYIVSSWGDKYYIDPNETINRDGKKTSFTFSYYQYN